MKTLEKQKVEYTTNCIVPKMGEKHVVLDLLK
jgi:hypothetical protein